MALGGGDEAGLAAGAAAGVALAAEIEVVSLHDRRPAGLSRRAHLTAVALLRHRVAKSPASWRTFTHAARHCSSVPYCCSNSASVSPCMIARIDPISCPSESILHRFRSGRKGGRLVDKRVSGWVSPARAGLICPVTR